MNTQEKSDERRMLADSVRHWATRAARPADRAASTQHPHGCPPQRWSELAEMGWLGVALSEADGGLGGDLGDACIIAEELGRALVVEPFVACAVLGSLLLAEIATGTLRQEWLPALAEGRRRIAFAPTDAAAAGRGEPTTATQQDGRWALEGDKALAPGVGGADGCIVSARTGAGRSGLLLVEAAAAQVQDHRLYDGRHAGTLALRHSAATLLVEAADAEIQAAVERALDRGVLAHCAETAGAMSAAFDITREYVLARSQFGKPIAANQVVQHRLVDLYVEIEEVRSLCHVTAAAPVPRLVAALAARTIDVARHTWEEAIQLHGAIGMTEEYVVGGYVRRLALATSLYGDAHRHMARLATLSLGNPE